MRRNLLLCLLLAALAAPLGAPAAAPRAVAGEAGARLRLGGGAEVALPATAGLQVANVAGDAGGWVAAGTVPADGGTRLALFAGDAAGARRLAPPAAPRAALAAEPLPLLRDGALAGLAWLEGEGRGALAVRFAPRRRGGWGPAVTVAPPGPGSQLALSGAALDDGSLLLAWSGYDGEDDEVLWSLLGPAGWSAPRRVAAPNRVPDITPALAAVPGGAIAAWSRYDGLEYRVVTAVFRDGGWREPRPIGPPGSLYPTFEAGGRSPLVLFRTAVPRGWAVVELDASGLPWRAARAAAAAAERPLVEEADGGLVLSWAGGAAARTVVAWEPLP